MTLPEIFINRMHLLLGDKTYSEFEQSFSEIPPVSIRYNPNKWKKEKNGDKVPWCESGYYLPSRHTFTFDPSFHAGTYYVQEASSMFLEQILNTYIKHPVVALDLCAAPGGKSTLTISKLPAGSVLVANEIIKLRSQKLAENIIKWGNPNVIVTNNQASDFSYLNEFFDLIICDVPCSGEGMFRKDAQAIEEWSSNNVDICQNRQREIINDIWSSLKPGGVLVYSTCTFNTLENEENIEWIVKTFGAEVLPCSPDEKWNITGNMCGTGHEVYRFLPHKTKGEGFFICALRKKNDESLLSESSCQTLCTIKSKNNTKKGKNQKNDKKGIVNIPKELKTWIHESDSFSFFSNATSIYAFPKSRIDILELIKEGLNVIHSGITIANIKGKNNIPGHSLAMSTYLNRKAFQSVEIDYSQAIAYLRTEAIVLPQETPTGIILLTYNDTPLGFAKNIGNRANNLYPTEWRIRSGHIPENVICV